jgi:transcription initiation factor IIE alpha subunit
MSTTVFKTEIVNGLCPACNFQVVLVSLANDHFRCTTCGSDLEQKINGKISYIPIMSSNQKDKIHLEITRDGEEI